MNTPTHTEDTLVLRAYPMHLSVCDMIRALFVADHRNILAKLLNLTQTSIDKLVLTTETFYISHDNSDTSRTVIALLSPEDDCHNLQRKDITARLHQLSRAECFNLIKTFLQLHEINDRIYRTKALLLAREYALQTGKESPL